MKIAVLSDTHNVIRSDVLKIIKSSDAVIHCGDITSREIFDEIQFAMKQNARLFIVRGNNDGAWAEFLCPNLDFELEGIKFFVTHDKKSILSKVEADIIIFGHSHKYYENMIGNCLWLNPGSCGRKRFNLPLTMAVLDIENTIYIIQKIEF